MWVVLELSPRVDLTAPPNAAPAHPAHYGVDGGGTRFFVACSKAYAISISFGSLHKVPVNPTPNGAGLALKPDGNAGFGAFGTIPNGTTTIG
jgi:hypothetical protein